MNENHNGSELFRVGLLLILLCPAGLAAQVVTGAISGRVTDTTGAVIPGAMMQIQNVETGLSRNVETDSAGRYVARNLPSGSYSVTAQQAGFQKQIRSGITLTVGSEAVVNLELSVGAVQETVQVSGEAPAVETTQATLSSLVTPEQMRELPLNGRSYDQLALLSPGVVSQPDGTRNQTQGAGLRLSSNGARADANLYLLDGTVVNDHSSQGPGSAAGQSLGIEAILEFRILTHNFSAEYGRNAGAVISAVTRSGTNQFHGSAYEFFRNNVLDARDFFNPGKLPPFRRNQFGASLGGPILKDRIFFFANYEGLRERRGTSVVASVPDRNARQGLLANPSTGGFTTIAIQPGVRPYLSLYPLPNGRNFGNGVAESIADFSSSATEDYSMERMDFHWSEKDSFYWRYVYDPSEGIVPRPLPTFIGFERGTNHFVVLNETHIFSGSTLNEFRFSMNRSVPRNGTGSLEPLDSSLDFIPGAGIGNIAFTTASGALATSVTEWGTSSSSPQTFTQNVFQAGDTFTTVRGAHSWKLGFNFERIQLNVLQASNVRGSFSFDSLTAFLQGRARQFQFQFIDSTHSLVRGYRQIIPGWFVQDDIRLRPNLTVNLGLRHEWVTTPLEVNGLSANMRNLTDRESTVGPPFQTSKKNFAPRVGLAWDPTRSGKTSVRLGAGLFHNEILGRTWYFFSAADSRFSARYIVPNPPFPNGLASGFTQGGTAQTKSVAWETETPALVHYNLEIQRQVVPTLTLRAGYVGSYGYHLTRATDSDIRVAQILPDGSKFFAANAPFINPNFSDIAMLWTDARSNYNALQVELQKSLSYGWQMAAAYTLAKNLSNADTISNSQVLTTAPVTMDPDNLGRDYGRSVYDRRHTFVLNSQYRFPWGKNLTSGVSKAALGGWTIKGILQAGSGFPFNIQTGFNNSRNGDRNQPDRPDLTPGRRNDPIHGTTSGCPGIPAGQKLRTADRYYDPCAFTLPAAGTYWNLGRNTVTGPQLFNVDFALAKTTPIHEGMNLDFRAEFFNLLNHTNLDSPARLNFSGDRSYNGNAGRVSQTVTTGRQIQLGLKLTF